MLCKNDVEYWYMYLCFFVSATILCYLADKSIVLVLLNFTIYMSNPDN